MPFFKKEFLDESLTPNTRDKIVIKASVIGITANVLLAAFKAFVGLMSNSIAVVLDAVNNLSDALSSVITIVGTKLAGKEPDKKHPFGHGRAEYLSAMIIAVIVLYAGITSLKESILKIIHPKSPNYYAVSLVIIGVAVIVKIILGRYVKHIGKEVNSDSLINSGQDATLDAVISAATLAAAVVYLAFGLSLEAWLGALISMVIIKSGIDMMRETISKILGERVDSELAKKIKRIVCSYPNVYGAYDLVLNNYGPDTYNGSIHIEVPDTYSAAQLDDLIRTMTVEVYNQCNVILTAIGVYSVNTKDEAAAKLREEIQNIVLSHEHVLQLHGFYVDFENKKIRFDMVISFDAKDRHALYREVLEQLRERFSEYSFDIILDTDFSESE